MEKYTYLILNIFTILGPLALSFDKKVNFVSKWKWAVLALIPSGLIYLAWDVLFTNWEIWGFNPDYLTGINIGPLPLEEVLFFFTVPFACLFIYECLRQYFPKVKSPTYLTGIVLLIIFITYLFFGSDKTYTLWASAAAIGTLAIDYFITKWKTIRKFTPAFLVCLIPFFIINGFLTALPVVWYDNDFNLGIRLGTIPIEDAVYLFGLLLPTLIIYTKLKSKK
ncbi:MAG: lycopene cyclase domain-containing protein [Sphingobacteriales bacterium]|jgi:lycopene cyclase domain-containing protein